MAYMSQENKKALAPQIKAVLKKYNMKGTIGVRHYSTLVVNVKSGALDIIGNMMENIPVDHFYTENAVTPTSIQVNTYHIGSSYTGKVADFLTELKDAMMSTEDGSVANHDNSDIMTDYFDVGWYIDINVGKYDKPYELTGKVVKLNVKKADTPKVEVDLWAEHLETHGSF